MVERGKTEKARLAIIAGRGALPVNVAIAARTAGEDPLIIALQEDAEQDWQHFQHLTLPVGDFQGLQAVVRTYGINRIVLSGGVTARPQWRAVRPTWKMVRDIPKIIRDLAGSGDDALLKLVISLIETTGCRVIGAQDIAPGLVARAGQLGLVAPDKAAAKDISSAAEAALALGKLDIGQGAVSIGGRVVALEGAEGTDQMLERVARLRLERRVRRPGGVLVKMAKPQQDMRADLPTIGPLTVEHAKSAGLSGIAVEAGRAFLLSEAETVAKADELGIFLWGFDSATDVAHG